MQKKFDTNNAMIANQGWFAEDDGDILFASPQSAENNADFRQGVQDAKLGRAPAKQGNHAYTAGYRTHTVVMAAVAEMAEVAI